MIFELVSPQCNQAVAKNCLQPTTVSNSMSRNKLGFQTHTTVWPVPLRHFEPSGREFESPGAPPKGGRLYPYKRKLGAVYFIEVTWCMKLTSQIWSATSLMPTVWPPNTVLMLILRLPKQCHSASGSLCVTSNQVVGSSNLSGRAI